VQKNLFFLNIVVTFFFFTEHGVLRHVHGLSQTSTHQPMSVLLEVSARKSSGSVLPAHRVLFNRTTTMLVTAVQWYT
jgi:hypothetical protein